MRQEGSNTVGSSSGARQLLATRKRIGLEFSWYSGLQLLFYDKPLPPRESSAGRSTELGEPPSHGPVLKLQQVSGQLYALI